MFNLTAVMETPLGVGGLTIESLLFFTLILVIGVLIARIVSINVRRALSERLPANERELFTNWSTTASSSWRFWPLSPSSALTSPVSWWPVVLPV